MARPVKKQPEQWKKEILDAAKELFLSKGYEETAITGLLLTGLMENGKRSVRRRSPS